MTKVRSHKIQIYSRDILGSFANATGPKWVFGNCNMLQTFKILTLYLLSTDFDLPFIVLKLLSLEEKLSEFQE